MGCIRGNAHPGAASSAVDGGATGIAIAPHSSSFATWFNAMTSVILFRSDMAIYWAVQKTG